MDPVTTSALIGAGSQGLGMIGGSGMSRKQYHRQKKLMGFQKGHQMDLNEHGKKMSMDLWNATNYGAQVEHMKDAGLNPALMYGTPGQGGSTNASGGGSAQSGQAPQERVMDMSNMLMAAQMNKLNSDAELNEAKAEATRGYERKESEANTMLVGMKTKEVEKGLKLLDEKIKSESGRALLYKYQAATEKIVSENKADVIAAEIGKLWEETNKLSLENQITGESKEALIQQNKNLMNLGYAKIGLTNAEIDEVNNNIVVSQGHLEIAGKRYELDEKIQNMQIEINKALKNIKLGGEIGKFILGIIKLAILKGK